jgi:hypothetical protein
MVDLVLMIAWAIVIRGVAEGDSVKYDEVFASSPA